VSVARASYFPALAPLLKVQTYDRDGGHRHPRHRIEVRDASADLRAFLLTLTAPCVACGRTIYPIRARKVTGRPSLYLAVACELTAGFGCARGRAAHLEYERIVAAVHLGAPEPLLFA
jgi:hypothetical protein